MTITYKEAKTRLVYRKKTGKLYWKTRTPDMFPNAVNPTRTCAAWNGKWAGKEAFTYVDPSNGYRYGSINGKVCTAHRIAWLLFFGRFPSKHIDHRNGNRQDNRLANLRAVTQSVNGRNRKRSKANTSGYTGVVVRGKRFQAQISFTENGKFRTKHLGTYDTAEEAYEARCMEQKKMGFSKRHGN